MNLFLTAALGSEDLLQAALRLEKQAQGTKLFQRTVIVTESNLMTICPNLTVWYPNLATNSTTGYGFFVWKSAIAEAAMNGYWGEFETVTYLDAGCEIVPGYRSKFILLRLLRKAIAEGVVAFSTGCAEWKYTKPFVWSYFKNLSSSDASDQFMGGVWILAGEKGTRVANTWNSAVSVSPEMTNDVVSICPTGFVSPRHDQSVFSLTLKSMNISPLKTQPPFPKKSPISRIAALRFPIWAARNRGKKSSINAALTILAHLMFPLKRDW